MVTNLDTKDKIQLTIPGLRHCIARKVTEPTAFITIHIGDAIRNAIKVNVAEGKRNNADSSYVLMGRMDDNVGNRYYYRIQVNRYESNKMSNYYIDDL